MDNHAVARFFDETPVSIAGNPRLRTPQIEGYAAASAHFAGEGPLEPAIEQIPVGCGKSGLIAVLPFGIAKGRVLVIAPNLTIRNQLMADLDATRAESFYRRTGVIRDPTAVPHLALLDRDANLSDARQAHIAITNIHQLAARVERWLPAFPDDFFDLIVVDEGHHNAATSWQGVFERFPKAKVLSLTATPFRGDAQPVHGKLIYRYGFVAAMRQSYVKQITAVNLAPTEISFIYEGDHRRHTLEEVLALKEENWFSRGVALAPECNKHIVEASVQWLDYLRHQTGFQHQLIGVACSVAHATEVSALYKRHGLNADVIHSRLSLSERHEVLSALRDGPLDAILQVEVLGEGFDHPPLSVGAIFRPFRSLNAYIQFVGRIMRVNAPEAVGHPDNRGIIVSHLGMNQDANWKDFKGIDGSDMTVIRGWLKAGEEYPPAENEPLNEWPRPPTMEVIYEVIDRHAPDHYLSYTDDAAIDNLMNVMREQGFDPDAIGLSKDEIRRRILEIRRVDNPEKGTGKPGQQPQRHRQLLRQRLDEQTRAAAGRVCAELGQAPTGTSIARLRTVPGQNNLGATIARIHRAVNAHLEIEAGMRRDLSLQEIESALSELDSIATGVKAQLQKSLDRAVGDN